MFDFKGQLPGGFLNRQQLDVLMKTLTAASTAGGYMIRQNLSDMIVKLTRRAVPFYDAVMARIDPGAGKATVYDRQTALGSTAAADMFFGETGLPLDDDATYEQITVAYKAFGKGKSLTEFMRRASKSFYNPRDAEAEVTETCVMEFVQGFEKALWYGDASVSGNLQFDGLLKTIPNSRKYDDSEAATSNSIIARIVRMVRKVSDSGGAPTAIYLTPGMHERVNLELNPGTVTILGSDGNRITAGVLVDSISTPVGRLPLKPTTHLTSTACTGGNTGKYKSSIVIVDEKNVAYEALAHAEKVYLPVATMLGDKFVIFSFGAPKWMAPIWCAEIQNALESDVIVET